MIAVVGIASETPVRLLMEACASKKIPCTLFNQRRQGDWSVQYDVFRPNASILANGDVTFTPSECSGLYLRTMDHTKLPEWAGTTTDRCRIEDMYSNLWMLLDDETLGTRVVNSPSVQLSNNSKPYQSIIIHEHGLDIPDTCITSDEDVAQDFLTKHAAVIYKSISGTRSIVKRADGKSLANLSRIRYCPVQFQECVMGFNVRVHVIGEQAIATRIRSDAVDYRYATQEGKSTALEPYDLSPDVAAKCVRLAHALRLPFAGIDLMMADDGRTICFEVNPSPGYSYYEQHTGQRISHALADLLAEEIPYGSKPVDAGLKLTSRRCG